MNKGTLKSYLEKLRASDEKTKRKIMIIAACVCMVVIVYVWLGYFNNLVSGSAQSVHANAQNVTAPQVLPPVSSTSFWDNVKNNADIFYKKISGELDNVQTSK